MAAEDLRISQLLPIADLVPASADEIAIVDVSKPAENTKKITIGQILGSPTPIGTGTENTGEFTAIGSISPGTGEFTTLELQLGVTIDEFSIDNTLSGDSDTVLVTEKAIKTYVDTEIVAKTDVLNVIHIPADSTAINGDVILIDSTGTTVTLINQLDARVYVKNLTSGTAAIQGNTGTIDGSSTYTLTFKYESVTIVCDGVNWFVL